MTKTATHASYKAGDWCMLPDPEIFDKHINGIKELDFENIKEK